PRFSGRVRKRWQACPFTYYYWPVSKLLAFVYFFQSRLARRPLLYFIYRKGSSRLNSRAISHCLVYPQVSYTSTLAYLALASINSLLGATSSPINIENRWSASAADSMVTFFNDRLAGSIVVLQSCSGFISPRPLYRCM